MAVAVVVAVAVSEGGAVAVVGLTKRNHIQHDIINVFCNFTQNEKHENHENKCAQMKV